jgi:thiamine biosynthesis lipoprotein
VSDVFVHTFAPMGTVVTFQIVGHGETAARRAERTHAVTRGMAWFESIEKCCSRFDPASEVRQLTDRAGTAVPVSAMLYEVVRFALAVADASDGAFDPTVGQRMEARGFTRHHKTGEATPSPLAADEDVSWRDVVLDANAKTVTLRKPLVLDLGAVAKGLAVDVAARELEPFENFAVDAGGDLYLGGHNASGEPWSVGIRHPREEGLFETLHVSNTAVCTSGDYERKSPADERAHHILDARTGESAAELASVTAFASSAMVADAFATAAFALGPSAGLEFLERNGIRGIMVTPSLERFETAGIS